MALRNKDAAIVTKSGRALTFASKPGATIPAGAVMVSDGVDLALPPQSDLAIDLYFPGSTERSLSPITLHNRGLQTNYVSGPGNHAGAEDLPGATTILVWHWLARVEVAGRQRASAVVTIGDSITDGTASTPNTNRRWPDELARRLLAQPRTRHLGVLNVGIGGNRLLSELNPGFGINLLARFDRDVLAQPGAAYAIVLEGINDIGFGRQSPSPPTAADLIAAHHQLVARAHARGLVIYGATLAPFEGANYWSSEGEATRQAVNNWIRTSGLYDGVIDFDAAVRDPQHPTKFLPEYNSGDNLHPSDAGYKAMAAAIDLKLFEANEGAASSRGKQKFEQCH